MCPFHWATFAFAAIPASLGLLGFLGVRTSLVRRKPHDARPTKGDA
jgi:hypothetical protein